MLWLLKQPFLACLKGKFLRLADVIAVFVLWCVTSTYLYRVEVTPKTKTIFVSLYVSRFVSKPSQKSKLLQRTAIKRILTENTRRPK